MAILLSLRRSWHVSACAMTWFVSLVSRCLWGTGPCQLRWPCSLWLLLPFHLTATSQLGGPKLKLRQWLKRWQATMISKRIKNCRYRGMLPRSCSVLKCCFFSTKTTPGINTLNDLFSYMSVFIPSFFFEMVFFWGGWCWLLCVLFFVFVGVLYVCVRGCLFYSKYFFMRSLRVFNVLRNLE